MLAVLGAVLLLPGLIAVVGVAVLTGDRASTAAGPVADIPPAYLALYLRDGTLCRGLDWAILAAIGKVETDHGRSPLPGVTSGENPAGAGGPMQFLADTFTIVTRAHPPPPGGARPASRYDASDAVHAAAAYLCDSGLTTTTVSGPGAGGAASAGTGGLYRAIWNYNHSSAYVHDVLTHAAAYRTAYTTATGTAAPAGSGTTAGAGSAVAARALAYARGQLGLPYQWGGNGPGAGDSGFDCSGLTTAAYAAAGLTLPRTAQTQYTRGPLLPRGAPIQAGDLLFFGTPSRVHHVGIALGEDLLMINAPHQGATIAITDARTFPDFLAASRPRQVGS